MYEAVWLIGNSQWNTGDDKYILCFFCLLLFFSVLLAFPSDNKIAVYSPDVLAAFDSLFFKYTYFFIKGFSSDVSAVAVSF